ncbi:MAG TPA: cyclase family protein [Patescibacteria group bacterium]|jgi:arylformamidase|nr:cyclase family protein [Patescibacteria group bacterium]
MRQLVDLSVALNSQTPVYPGDPAIRVEPAGVFERNGYTDHLVSFGNHTGTHIDAPLHMVAGGKTLDEYSPERFVGHGRVVDVRNGFNLAALQHAGIQPGDLVLFYTGMSSRYHQSIYFEIYPVMSSELAQWLVKQKVKMVGVDACSVDNQKDLTIHKALLGGEVLIIENLTNLEQLLGKDFIVYALPIKLNIDGAPARVVAQIEEH